MKLPTNQVTDFGVRENLTQIEEEFNQLMMLPGQWKHFEITFLSAVTNFKYPHGLSFVPKDVIQTSTTGTGVVTWKYANFDRSNLVISTTGPCVVRAFIGTYSRR